MLRRTARGKSFNIFGNFFLIKFQIALRLTFLRIQILPNDANYDAGHNSRMVIFFCYKWKLCKFMMPFFENPASSSKRLNPMKYASFLCCSKTQFKYSILRAKLIGTSAWILEGDKDVIVYLEGFSYSRFCGIKLSS